MSIDNLDKIFHPKSIAIIGASHRVGSVGNTVLKNVVEAGFAGNVYPVNPKHTSLCDVACYPSVAAIDAPVDLAIICTPAPSVAELVKQCGDVGVRGLIVLTAGFREVGETGKRLEEAIRNQVSQFPSMKLIGPNCVGVLAPHTKLNASFAADLPLEGNIALISQSGALCTSILDWSLQKRVGFSHFVSVGNMLDVDIADLIEYFATDKQTDAMLLYLESITHAKHFMSAATEFAKQKPIIAYKAGRFAQSAQAATSHTGAMAGVDAVYEAALRRAGVVRVFTIEDLFDGAELLARHQTLAGDRLAIVTNAGGPGVMATDALLEAGGTLTTLSNATIDRLNLQLPPAWSHGNPVDVLGDAPPARLGQAVELVLQDETVDAVLTILTPQAMTDPTEAAQAVIEVANRSNKPVLTSWLGGAKVSEGVHRFDAARIPNYETPEQAVRAFMTLFAAGRNRKLLAVTAAELPEDLTQNGTQRRAEFSTMLADGQPVLSEIASKALLTGYGIAVAKTVVASSAEEAMAIANQLEFPIAMKVFSPQITHKTDVGGVALNLTSPSAVRDAYERIVSSAQRHCPHATIDGVTIQPMVTSSAGMELILGAKCDPVFGPVMLVGAGGITAELYRDQALELLPLNEILARRSLESLRCWPLLNGFRGRPAANIDGLIDAMIRLSHLIADFPEITEIDINPLLVTPTEATALDARIVVASHD